MKLKTRIILGFTMIILMPLLLFAATLYGFSQSQAQKAQAVTESDGTVYDISITDSADSQGRVHVMAKDLFISAFVILISVALVVGLWVYRSIAVPLVKLKKATQNIKEGNLDFVLDVEGKDEFSELCQDFEEMRRRLKESTEEKSLMQFFILSHKALKVYNSCILSHALLLSSTNSCMTDATDCTPFPCSKAHTRTQDISRTVLTRMVDIRIPTVHFIRTHRRLVKNKRKREKENRVDLERNLQNAQPSR